MSARCGYVFTASPVYREAMQQVFGAAMKKEDAMSTAPTKADIIERMEKSGNLVEDCAYCRRWYESEDGRPGGPTHKASPLCRSGGHPHCTCDTCF